MKPSVFVAVIALLVSDAQAWVSPMQTSVMRTSNGKSVLTTLAAEKESLDKVQLTSGKKEILFDEKAGRFFETNRDAAECIPEEEYCTIDEDTGKRIRLTIAEKERIFLDSLQVCSINYSIEKEQGHHGKGKRNGEWETCLTLFWVFLYLVILRKWSTATCR